MALIGSERDAVQILVNRIEREGNFGLKNFARTVLGAHSEQARRLADMAEQVSAGNADFDSLDFRDSGIENVTVRTEVDGKELDIELRADRLPITSYEQLVEFYDIDTDVWQPTEQSFSFWGNGDRPNFNVKARFTKDEYKAAQAEDRETFREWAKDFSPEPPERPVVHTDDDLMLEIVVSDLHADRVTTTGGGIDRALARVRHAVTSIFRRAYWADGKVSEVHLVFNGDTFNADNGKGTTTNGTPQEVEADWRESFRRVRAGIASIVNEALDEFTAKVHIHIIWGNHDYERAYYLADSLWAYFHNDPQVEVDIEAGDRRYIEWGTNLIGLTHGDRNKPVDLAMSMFREANTVGKRFFEWHLGHIHTRREDEIHGVTFQWFRSPNDPGMWEEKQMFNHNNRDIVGMLWHKDQGNIATYRHSFTGKVNG